MTLAFISDRLRHRWFFAFISAAVCLIGFAVLLSDPPRHSVRYGALFLAVSGAYSSMPIVVGGLTPTWRVTRGALWVRRGKFPLVTLEVLFPRSCFRREMARSI